jgi:hypothetical protein
MSKKTDYCTPNQSCLSSRQSSIHLFVGDKRAQAKLVSPNSRAFFFIHRHHDDVSRFATSKSVHLSIECCIAHCHESIAGTLAPYCSYGIGYRTVGRTVQVKREVQGASYCAYA